MEDMRGARGFIWLRGSKIDVSLVVGLKVAIHQAVRTRVSLVDIGLAGSSRRVRCS